MIGTLKIHPIPEESERPDFELYDPPHEGQARHLNRVTRGVSADHAGAPGLNNSLDFEAKTSAWEVPQKA